MQKGSPESPRLVWGLLLWCAALLLAAGGCAGSDDSIKHEPGFTRIYTPQPPTFLIGPMAVLLTNGAGFSSRVELHENTAFDRENPVSGHLLVSGSKLLFAPEVKVDKHSGAGDFSFVWDVNSQSGFLFSEALQGYAPLSVSGHSTNLITAVAQAAPQNIGGHPCQAMDTTVQMSDGSTASFQVLRATDLGGVPLHINSSPSNTMTLSLSKVRLEALSADLFGPPEGFTRYASPETLVDELAARKHNLRRRSHDMPLTPLENPGTAPARPY